MSTSTPQVLGTVPGFVPVDVAGDAITHGHVRSRKWFITGFDAGRALDLYTAAAAHVNLIDPHSFSGNLETTFLRIQANANYFRNWNIVMCAELTPTTGRCHVHAAVLTSQPITRKALRDVFGPWDMRVMRGTPTQARDYVIKSGNMAVYIGDATVWDAPPPPKEKAPPIDWQHVLSCCNAVRSFPQFKRQFIDGGDNDCIRASIARVNFIKDLIAANSPPKKAAPVLLTLWQRAILTLCKSPPLNSHRKINWIWSPESGTGKSSITDLIINDGTKVFVWPQGSSVKDAVYMYDEQPVIVFDVPREGGIENLYPLLETVSDQILVSAGKYMGVVKRFYAHVLVLANTSPEQDRLPGRIEEIRVKPLADEAYELVDIATQLSFE